LVWPLFDPKTGERRLRLIEEEEEYNRVRRLHPQADESLLRAWRDNLASRFRELCRQPVALAETAGNGGGKQVSHFATTATGPAPASGCIYWKSETRR